MRRADIRRPESSRTPSLARRLPVAFIAVVCVAFAHADEQSTQPLRWEAAIRVERPATFVALPVPTALYAKSQQSLADLRVVDARGERVPFTLLAPRRAVETSENGHEAALFALPALPASGASWQSPVDVVIESGRITVQRRGATTPQPFPGVAPPGWLIDTGTPRDGELPPARLRLRWSGPAEFTAAYRIETSHDLRAWRPGGSGQLIALAATGAAAPLTQPLVELPDAAGRFVRLVWFDAAAAPLLTGVAAIASQQRRVDVDPPVELRVDAAVDPREPRALVFDLGAALPVDDVALRFVAGNRIAPVKVEGRRTATESWRDFGATVFNRFERDGGTSAESVPFPLGDAAGPIRFIRVVVDERAARLGAADARLVAHVRLATLVFAAEGAAPWRLLVGSVDAPAGALPPATLVPRLDEERARFGSATVGELREIPEAARAVERDAQTQRLRPVVLWAVLLLGVATLGAMVWRLARGATKGPTA